jgi:hypothetical protein
MRERTPARHGARMTADDPYDDDAAGDKALGRDRFSDSATQASRRQERDVDAEPSTGAPGREHCFDELQAYDRKCPSASRSSDKAQLTDGGGWAWKGLELSPAQNRIADEEIAARQKAEGRDAEGNYGEGGITPAMRRIEAELEHGSLVPDTEKFALKSPDRFKEKLAKMISLEPDIAPGTHAANVHDGIRFTFLFEGDYYSDTVREVESRIAEGHEFVERKPNWSGQEYKGINSKWRDTDSGQLFEVQFHTPESWDAKQKTHDAYEKIECATTAPEERARLRAYQRQVSASVPVPPGALDFTPYKAGDDGDCHRA